MNSQPVLLAYILIGLALWPGGVLALPACPGQRFYLKTGEVLDIQFNRRLGCDVRYMTVERGSVDRRLFYPSGRNDHRVLTTGQHDVPEAWSELPRNARLKATTETVVRFLAERPLQSPAQTQPNRQNTNPSAIQITLLNRTNETITYQWVNRSGDGITYGSVPAGGSAVLNTFNSHIWRIKRTRTNETILQFDATPNTHTVRIDSLEPLFPRRPQRPPTFTSPIQRRTQSPAIANLPRGELTMGFFSSLWSTVVVLFWLGLFGGVIYAFVKTLKSIPSIIFSHWYALIEDLNCSSLAFYDSVGTALGSRRVPQSDLSRIVWPEGGVFSARREYLRIKRKDLIFDICAAPFGTGFFISWWLGPKPGLCGFFYGIPVIGVLLQYLMRPFTYYQIDTALMFQEAVNNSVQEVIDALTKAQGLRSLSENERKPTLRDFFQR